MIPAQAISHPELPSSSSSGARLVTPDGRALPLVSSALAAEAEGGLARVTLTQRFRNTHAEPLSVTYSLPLPADGAVSGFSFQIGERRVVGEIDRKKAARERYERALVEGRSAALLEQDRSSLFTQEIGNIPPGAELVVEVLIDQRLTWLHEGAWEWRFPTVVSPRYLGEPGRVEDAARVAQDVSLEPLEVRIAVDCQIRDALSEGRRPESPSHAITSAPLSAGARVELARGARLDRDVVVRWAVAAPKVGLSLVTGRPAAERPTRSAAYGLLTLVPPHPSAKAQPIVRDLIVLLDTSGSMGGEPLNQARRVVGALLGTLGERDRLELIEFSSAPRRWKPEPVAATKAALEDALAWLSKLRASGSTEMRTGILEALGSLRAEAQRQVVLVSDGQIGFESEVISAICDKLPASSRLHTVGVGSAVNRSLTSPAARAGRGLEIVIGLGEDPERAAARLLTRTVAPILVELELDGAALIEHAPRRLPDLFEGAPALLSVALRPEGGEIRVRGRTAEGIFEERLLTSPIEAGGGSQTVVALYGREAVEDREMELAGGGEKRTIDAAVERLGLDFQIATRLTSWVAVTQEKTVDPRDALRHERMPHELPHGVSAEGLGLRPALAHGVSACMAVDPMEDEEIPTTVALREPADGGSGAIYRPSSSRATSASGTGGPGAPPPAPFMPSMKMKAPAGSFAPKSPPLPPSAEAPAPPRDTGALRPKREDATSPPPKAKGGGVIGAVRRLFGSKGGELPSQGEGAGLGNERRLKGQIALRSEGDLVIQVPVLGAPLEWDPGFAVEILLADGSTVTATVDATSSTRPATLVPGQLARLSLKLASGPLSSEPRAITLTRGEVKIIIEV